jgi:hypothetical protein
MTFRLTPTTPQLFTYSVTIPNQGGGGGFKNRWW